jgi:uncharacterized coiled-coil DUF342 family protein
MEKSVEEMKKQRDEFQQKANELKKKRDELHLQSKKLAEERDELNAKIRDMRNKIKTHKNARDDFNDRVKHAKEQRNEINSHLGEIKKRIKDLERERSSTIGVNLNRLKQNLRKLETEQMTQPMSSQKEKKLIETISDLHAQIKENEEILNKDPKLKGALEEEKTLRMKAEKQHDFVEKMAKRAQEEHQAMIEILASVDGSVQRATEIQETIVMTKIDADKVHKEFIEHVNTIHELERNISSVEETKRKREKAVAVSSAQRKADEIFEKFKRGDKLSTEDLMILQKAGLI